MADKDEISTAKSKPKSKKMLFIIGGAAALVIVGGVGGYFALSGGKSGEAHAEAADHGGGHEAAAADGHGEPAKVAAFIDLPEMVVNLATSEPEKQQYIRMTIALEVANAQVSEAIKPLMPRVIDSFQTHLREMRPADIRGSSGAYRLKEELLRRVNVAIAPARADAVLFKDIVVQ